MLLKHVLCWICLLLTHNQVIGQMEIRYTSLGAPDFYINDIISFTCDASGWQLFQRIDFSYVSPDNGYVGCETYGSTDRWVGFNCGDLNVGEGMDASQLTDEYCASVGASTGFSITVNVTLTSTNLNGDFRCFGIQENTYNAYETVGVGMVKVAPQQLTMEFIPPDIIENKPFKALCHSVGASPNSEYKYEIRSGYQVVSETGIYTPTVTDRSGLVVQCVDMAHNNWRGGNTFRSAKIYPSYIEIVGNGSLHIFLDKTSMHTLNCSGHVIGQPKPHLFQWFRSGSKQSEKSNIFQISYMKGVGIEEVTCSANNGIVDKSVEIRWLITWIEGSKVTTTMSPTPRRHAEVKTAVITIAVSGAALFFVALVYVACLHKRKNNGRGASSGETEPLLSRCDGSERGSHAYSYISDSQFVEERSDVNTRRFVSTDGIYSRETISFNQSDTRTECGRYVCNPFLDEPPELPSRSHCAASTTNPS